MKSIRVLYLTRSLAINGRGAFGGRDFVAQLRADGAEVMVRHQLVADVAAVADPAVRADVFSEEDLGRFQPACIVAEDLLAAAGGSQLRIPAPWLRTFVHGGGVLLVEGMSHSTVSLDIELIDAKPNAVWRRAGNLRSGQH